MDNRSLNFWAERSKGYNQLEWANSQALIKAIIHCGDFEKPHLVLDIGTGTGIMAKAVAPLVDRVIGIDFSLDMLKSFDGSLPDNCYMVKADIREPLFNDGQFDRIVARYAFHHFVDFAQEAVNQCYRILKPKGRLIICEGTPPTHRLRRDYERIFALKEDRLTFMEQDLIMLMSEAGFKTIGISLQWLRKMSVRNWLDSSGLSEPIKNTIFDMHVNSSPEFKNDYNLKLTKNDCLIDMRQVIVTGVK